MTALPQRRGEPLAVVMTTARRFKIAVFSYGLPSPGEKRGGIEQVAHDLANALVDRGHTVTVFTYDKRPTDAHYDIGDLPCRTFVTSWVGRRLSMGYLGNLFALGPRYSDFDVVIAHGDSLFLPLRGRPVIRVMHGSALEEARTATSIGRTILQVGIYAQELMTAICQRSTVAVSANTRRFNPFIQRVIPNGIDLTRFTPNASARSPRPTLLFVGALSGRKRGGWLIERFIDEIRPTFPDAELHMVTALGPEAPGITYHTGISRNALVTLYQRAWVYASPSTYEGFGLPYVEALACGTPVVATPNPGSREVLDEGRYGVLASDERFVVEVKRVLSDSFARAELAREGLVRASLYDVARSAALYKGVIEERVA